MHQSNRSARAPGRTVVRLCLAWAVTVLVACSGAPGMRGTASTEPGGAVAVPAPDALRYSVVAERSEIRFIVRRAGTLARLGHNHVILARGVEGVVAVAPELDRSSVQLRLPVVGFEVDPPAARAALGAGFEPVPPQAVAGTRRNMLSDKVLDAARHVAVEVDTVAVAPGAADTVLMTVRMRVRGVARDQQIPVTVTRDRSHLDARAEFTVRQRDFGITPLSVLGGALQVADAVTVKLHIVAVRCDDSSLCAPGADG